MMLHKTWRILMIAVFIALFNVGLSFVAAPVSAKSSNQYGPQTVTIFSACPTTAPVVKLPIDPSQIQSITVSGKANGSLYLHDTAGAIDSNASGSYSFTTTKTDELDACVIGGGSGTLSFQGQLNINTANYAGYGVSGFNASPNEYTDIVGFWHVPSISCSVLENSQSATWIGLGGMKNAGSSKIEQIGSYQYCNEGLPTYHAVYENFPASRVIIWQGCSLSNYQPNTCTSANKRVYANVSPNDYMQAYIHYANGGFSLILEDQTQNWYDIESFQSSDPSIRYSAEWIEEFPDSPGLTNFHQVTFSQCHVDGQLLSLGGASVEKLTIRQNENSPIQAQATGLTNGNSFSVQWKHS